VAQRTHSLINRYRAVIGGIAVFVAGLLACGGPAATTPISAAGKRVKVLKGDPAGSCEELGPVSVTHGNGCGGFGEAGTYDGAYALLKNEAGARGANYVRIDATRRPYGDGQCFHNEFTIEGMAYNCPE